MVTVPDALIVVGGMLVLLVMFLVVRRNAKDYRRMR